MTDFARRRDNDLIHNGHKARQCPYRVDVSLITDSAPRWAHGECKPPMVNFTFADANGNEFTITGDVLTLDRKVGYEHPDELTIKMHGMVEKRSKHDRPHFRLTEDRHGERKECLCECRKCLNKINDKHGYCNCLECHCNAD